MILLEQKRAEHSAAGKLVQKALMWEPFVISGSLRKENGSCDSWNFRTGQVELMRRFIRVRYLIY